MNVLVMGERVIGMSVALELVRALINSNHGDRFPGGVRLNVGELRFEAIERIPEWLLLGGRGAWRDEAKRRRLLAKPDRWLVTRPAHRGWIRPTFSKKSPAFNHTLFQNPFLLAARPPN